MERRNRKSKNFSKDIIDIDSTYEDFEESDSDDEENISKTNRNRKLKKDAQEKTDDNLTDEDEFNLSLLKWKKR